MYEDTIDLNGVKSKPMSFVIANVFSLFLSRRYRSITSGTFSPFLSTDCGCDWKRLEARGKEG